MKELLLMLAKAIVDQPDEVTVDIVPGERAEILELRVAPDDMGKVIGKRGRTVSALRTIVKAAASKQGKEVLVEVVD